jgi:hypothetical protein
MASPAIPRREYAMCAALALAFFVMYGAHACRTVSLNGDSAELVTAAALWGVPHAPGYPLFTAFGHLFAALPVLTVAGRVHLTSAVFHAATVGFTAATVLEATRSRLAGAAAGCALGTAKTFVLGSLYAEVFPLNDLFFAALFFLAVRLRAFPSPARALGFAALAGLASAHHMMIALAAPALAILLLGPLLRLVRTRPATLGLLVLAFLVPFATSYALVPLAASRDPALSWGDVHDTASFLAVVTRHDYGGLFSSVHGAGHGSGPERLVALGEILGDSFGPFTLAAALGGAIVLLRRSGDRSLGLALVTAAIVVGPVFAWANALGTATEEGLAHFARFATMAHLPVALAAGAAVPFLGELARRFAPPLGARAGIAALVVWVALGAIHAFPIDLHDDRRGEAFAHDLVLHSPDRSLLLLSGDAPNQAALYVCAVEHLCGERVALSPGSLFLPWAMAQARRRHPEITIPWTNGPGLKRTHEIVAAEIARRPVFAYPDLLEKDPLLQTAFRPLPDLLLFRLWPLGSENAAMRAALDASAQAMAGGGCEGCRLPPPEAHPTQEMQLVHAYEAARVNHARAASALP